MTIAEGRIDVLIFGLVMILVAILIPTIDLEDEEEHRCLEEKS